jgi:hypothetical protein
MRSVVFREGIERITVSLRLLSAGWLKFRTGADLVVY